MSRRIMIKLPDGRQLIGPQTAAELNLLNYVPLAKKFAGKYQHHFDDFDDAFQVAWLGLLLARDKWDPERGPFGTIVKLYVKNAFRIELDDRQRAAGLALPDRISGRAMAKRGHKFHKRIAGFKTVSSEIIGPSGEAISLFDYIADDTPNAEELLGTRQETAALKQRIAEALTSLDPRERIVIDARIMAEKRETTCRTPKAATLETLASELGVSRERVRQLEVRALAKLRAFLEHGPPPLKGKHGPPPRLPPKQRAIAAPSAGRQRRPPPPPASIPDIPAEARGSKAAVIRWLMGQPAGVTAPEAAGICAALFPGTGRAIIAGRLTVGTSKAREPSRGVVYRLA